MFQGKSKISTIFLLVITFLLLGSIIYISFLLNPPDKESSSITPRQTKAANITYSKLIALNRSPTEVANNENLQPSVENSPVPTETTPTEMESPTPTEIILAYKNQSITGEATEAGQITSTVVPTKVKNLPDVGFIYNGLVIFAAAMLLVFFSFLF